METSLNMETMGLAFAWGALSGYLMIRTLDSVIAIIFCLHGLLMSRWKRLVNRASPGQIKYNIILRLLLQVTLYGLLFGFFLEMGDTFATRTYRFAYQGTYGLVWGVTAGIIAAIFLRPSFRRLVMVWKMTHHFDYAEKRQRTFLLKG